MGANISLWRGIRTLQPDYQARPRRVRLSASATQHAYQTAADLQLHYFLRPCNVARLETYFGRHVALRLGHHRLRPFPAEDGTGCHAPRCRPGYGATAYQG